MRSRAAVWAGATESRSESLPACLPVCGRQQVRSKAPWLPGRALLATFLTPINAKL